MLFRMQNEDLTSLRMRRSTTDLGRKSVEKMNARSGLKEVRHTAALEVQYQVVVNWQPMDPVLLHQLIVAIPDLDSYHLGLHLAMLVLLWEIGAPWGLKVLVQQRSDQRKQVELLMWGQHHHEKLKDPWYLTLKWHKW